MTAPCPSCESRFDSERGMKIHFSQIHNSGGEEPFECIWCGGWFSRSPNIVTKNPTCSKPCNSAWQSERSSGENAPNWKGGRSNDRGQEWEVLTMFIRTRDEGCLRCGRSKTESGRRLHVHHLTHEEDVDGEDDPHRPTNLVSLCFGCHQKLEGESLDSQFDELSIDSRRELAFSDDQQQSYEQTRKRMMPKLRAPSKGSHSGKRAWSEESCEE